MKVATVLAIAELAQAEIPDLVAAAYKGVGLCFGREYLIPKPCDPRLIEVVAPAGASAAAETGVARRPIKDMEAYRLKLKRFVYHSGSAMEPGDFVITPSMTWHDHSNETSEPMYWLDGLDIPMTGPAAAIRQAFFERKSLDLDMGQ